MRNVAPEQRLRKIGGVKKQGEVQIYRYISYRISTYEVSLAAVMVSADEDCVSWRIDGSDELVPEKTQRYCGLEISYRTFLSSRKCAQFSLNLWSRIKGQDQLRGQDLNL